MTNMAGVKLDLRLSAGSEVGWLELGRSRQKPLRSRAAGVAGIAIAEMLLGLNGRVFLQPQFAAIGYKNWAAEESCMAVFATVSQTAGYGAKLSYGYHNRLEMDTITSAKRSALMSRIRSKDTTPELVVRALLHRLGYRFRLHRKDLPGCPDIVLPRHGKVVLVHGCFWHGHSCKLGSKPKTNVSYWRTKIRANRARDARNRKELTRLGWAILELWECEVRRFDGLEGKLQEFMQAEERPFR